MAQGQQALLHLSGDVAGDEQPPAAVLHQQHQGQLVHVVNTVVQGRVQHGDHRLPQGKLLAGVGDSHLGAGAAHPVSGGGQCGLGGQVLRDHQSVGPHLLQQGPGPAAVVTVGMCNEQVPQPPCSPVQHIVRRALGRGGRAGVDDGALPAAGEQQRLALTHVDHVEGAAAGVCRQGQQPVPGNTPKQPAPQGKDKKQQQAARQQPPQEDAPGPPARLCSASAHSFFIRSR